MIQILCDTHTHTLFSRHAYSTVEEDVRGAADQGMELLGVTDHYSAMLFEEQSFKNFQYFVNFGVWPREWHGVRLLHGCEADIVDVEGHLFGHDIPLERNITGEAVRRPHTLKDVVFRGCDYVVASVHNKQFTLDATPAQNAAMYIRALEDPKVLILGHIGRSGVDFELDPVIEAARDLGKLVEINGGSLWGEKRARSLERCRRVAERCAELGCMVSFGSDAHISWEVGRTGGAVELLESVHFPPELVACRSAEVFLGVARAALPDFPL